MARRTEYRVMSEDGRLIREINLYSEPMARDFLTINPGGDFADSKWEIRRVEGGEIVVRPMDDIARHLEAYAVPTHAVDLSYGAVRA